MTIILILLLFFALLFLGMPIAFVIGIVVAATLLFGGVPLEIIVQRMFAGVNNFSYLAIPVIHTGRKYHGKRRTD
jgi:C4-dicarboxylate transporter DctM subunit